MCIQRGQSLPDALANAPFLLQGLEHFYLAFQELSSCRPVGMGIGAIPWTAIREYAQQENFVGEDYEEFMYMIREMDNAWLEYQNEKAKAARDTRD